MTELDDRKKGLRLNALRRGFLETELALRPFLDAELADMGPDELDALEAFLAMEDLDLWEVLSGRRKAPGNIDPDMVKRARSHLGPKP